MRRAVFASFGLALLWGCATNPVQEYNTLLANTSATNEITTATDALAAGNAIALARTERLKFEIDPTDNKINLDGTRSFFQIFSITTTANTPIQVKTFSHMKSGPAGGLGPLYVVWPRVFILDGSGTVLSEKPKGGDVSRAALGFGPLQYEASWQAIAPSDGKVFVVVTSDNRVLNETMASHEEVLPAGTLFVPWSYGLKAHSTGAMSIEWQ